MVAIAPYKGDIELIGINNPISDHQVGSLYLMTRLR